MLRLLAAAFLFVAIIPAGESPGVETASENCPVALVGQGIVPAEESVDARARAVSASSAMSLIWFSSAPCWVSKTVFVIIRTFPLCRPRCGDPMGW